MFHKSSPVFVLVFEHGVLWHLEVSHWLPELLYFLQEILANFSDGLDLQFL